MLNIVAELFEQQVESTLVLEAFFDLWNAVEVGLFDLLIDIELIFNGGGVGKGVGLEDVAAVVLDVEDPLNEFASFGLDNFVDFILVLDHGGNKINKAKIRLSTGGLIYSG